MHGGRAMRPGWKQTLEGDILDYVKSRDHPVTFQDIVDKMLPKYGRYVTKGVISSYLIKMKSKGILESELLGDHVRIYWCVGE